MSNATKGLIGLSAALFLLTVVSGFMGPIMGVSPEGFSRGCSNLALLAIAISVGWKNGSSS